ncbi:alpha-defensin 1-like [Phyllostomus hastatus]|uniref:alpha-defensin 1-like n=1 Tax=Phyllostomus hastatus TaxID=9423 RepID=UPI001E67FE35|nr:alpha-defensin 1-like [Phyllostomus hastatus]
MRTLTLLAALLLLAFQAQAGTLQETADQVPAQDQPGVKDQDLLGDEDQDVAVSFTREERSLKKFLRKRPLPPDLRKKIQKVKEVLKGIVEKTPIRIPLEGCRCRPQDQ